MFPPIPVCQICALNALAMPYTQVAVYWRVTKKRTPGVEFPMKELGPPKNSVAPLPGPVPRNELVRLRSVYLQVSVC